MITLYCDKCGREISSESDFKKVDDDYICGKCLKNIIITDVREFGEEYSVLIEKITKERDKLLLEYHPEAKDRLVIVAYNEGHCNATLVDLIDLLQFVKREMSDVWNSI